MKNIVKFVLKKINVNKDIGLVFPLEGLELDAGFVNMGVQSYLI
jgi:hypothetical protein